MNSRGLRTSASDMPELTCCRLKLVEEGLQFIPFLPESV
jgi:hypothetical protein